MLWCAVLVRRQEIKEEETKQGEEREEREDFLFESFFLRAKECRPAIKCACQKWYASDLVWSAYR